MSFFFFFQAEDGIRDFHVTGVQTCALPIFGRGVRLGRRRSDVEDGGSPPGPRDLGPRLVGLMPAKASRNAKLRPLWACPRCGQRFVSPNMWHSCVRMTIGDHLRGRPKEVVDLYRRFAEMVRDLGPGVKAVPVKTGIGFMVRVRVAGVALQKRGLRATFWLKDR